jgi:3-isopropylmalate/(R)-2-methylmalate dehydratase small subunit
MKAFTQHTGLVAAMDRNNVDTDQIIPKQFLKRIERTGFGQCLFYDWRFAEDGTPKADFELNDPKFQGASILLARQNFGCGSSREHAAWALDGYGFRVLIAPSFADIFYNNCFKNGILPIVLAADQVDELFRRTEQFLRYTLSVDLESNRLTDEHGLDWTFEVDAFRKYCLLGGLDDITLTLEHLDRISAYEAAHGISEHRTCDKA